MCLNFSKFGDTKFGDTIPIKAKWAGPIELHPPPTQAGKDAFQQVISRHEPARSNTGEIQGHYTNFLIHPSPTARPGRIVIPEHRTTEKVA